MNGTLSAAKASSPGLLEYSYRFKTGAISSQTLNGSITVNSILLPLGTDVLKLEFSYLSTNASSANILIVSTANVSARDIRIYPNPASLGAVVYLEENLSNNAFFRATNVTANVRVVFPDGSVYNLAQPLGTLSAQQFKEVSINLGTLSRIPGRYAISTNVSYDVDYAYQGLPYVSQKFFSRTSAVSYTVLNTSVIQYSISPASALPPIPGAAQLVFSTFPYLTTILLNGTPQGLPYLGLHNSGQYPITVSIGAPKLQFGILSTSADTISLTPNQTLLVALQLSHYSNATPGLYQVPISLRISNATSNTTTYAQVLLQLVAPTGPAVLKSISLSDNGSNASVSLAVVNPSDRTLYYPVVTDLLNSSAVSNRGDINAGYGNVTVRNGGYSLMWGAQTLLQGHSGFQLGYLIHNLTKPNYLLLDSLGLSSSSSYETKNFSILDIAKPPIVQLNKSANITLTGVYSGPSATTLSIALLSQNGEIDVKDPQQSVFVRPDSVFVTRFEILPQSPAGNQTLQLIISGQSIQTQTRYLNINVTTPPTPLQLFETQLNNPMFAALVSLIAIVVIAATVKAYSEIAHRTAKSASVKRLEDLPKLMLNVKDARFVEGKSEHLFKRHRNPDGTWGGFVESTATAGSKTYIGPKALVLNSSSISGRAKISDSAVISENAKVRGTASVAGHALVYGSATLFDYAEVHDNASVFDSAEVGGHATIRDNAKVHGKSAVFGDAVISGNADVCGTANIYGDVEIKSKKVQKGDLSSND